MAAKRRGDTLTRARKDRRAAHVEAAREMHRPHTERQRVDARQVSINQLARAGQSPRHDPHQPLAFVRSRRTQLRDRTRGQIIIWPRLVEPIQITVLYRYSTYCTVLEALYWFNPTGRGHRPATESTVAVQTRSPGKRRRRPRWQQYGTVAAPLLETSIDEAQGGLAPAFGDPRLIPPRQRSAAIPYCNQVQASSHVRRRILLYGTVFYCTERTVC